MERLIITGGARLKGSVTISGAKNAILPILASCLLSDTPLVLEGVPRLDDVVTMQEVLQSLGAKVKWLDDVMEIDPSNITSTEVPASLMRRMRASNLVMGALLGRLGNVRASYPGGCTIGSRPMDLHLKGFGYLGAKVHEHHGFIEMEAAKLTGTEIHLDFPSVGATENIMMAAVLAEGTTTIRNAAREPEIVDLQNFLNRLGAEIRGAGLDIIQINGVSRVGREIAYRVIPDRIETGTFMVAAAITRGEIEIINTIPEHVEPVTAKLREAGIRVWEEDDRIIVKGVDTWNALDIRTLPYPGFPTDMQPQFMVFLSLAQGTSIITENIFENRFQHVGELRRMGAHIRVEGRSAVISGVPNLTGALVEATDLRAGAALVLGGLAAENTTIVEGVEHINRGYEKLDAKLRRLGAQIRRE
ncbi:MAG TPA: UDP-N-acetylglucosamine 1-carboxyvinyltransferase [Syntrophomonadaceae bacterium]|nr:UDP-N-acetylglucosamine 1-carboxyvinyltransferase [Syntrophomonadaceae bacterium]